MDTYRSTRRDWPQERKSQANSSEGTCFLLSGEAQLLQAISACAPLSEILNGICSALDGQIGNVVSLICLREDDAAVLAAIAENPMRFGLHAFCSAGVFGENDELLGSLEMYCCIPRSPSLEEIHLIERATSLAALAIKRFMETGIGAGDDGIRGMDGNRPVSGYELKWPDSMN